MSRFCKVCGRFRANEKFGGRGLRKVVCRNCMRLPKEERLRALHLDEIHGFWDQKNISAKNIKRLKLLESSEDQLVAAAAQLTRRIAEVHPRKRKRWNVLRSKHRELYSAAVEQGWHEYPEYAERSEYDEWLEDDDWSEYEEDDFELEIDDLDNLWIESAYGGYAYGTFWGVDGMLLEPQLELDSQLEQHYCATQKT